jgi:hypothetical protein
VPKCTSRKKNSYQTFLNDKNIFLKVTMINY